ncbi:MAG: DUF4175 family protein [Planctomycetaceae bacterium]
MATNMSASSIPREIEQKLSDVEQRTMMTRVKSGTLVTATSFLLLLMLSMLIDSSLVLFSTTARTLLTITVLAISGVVLYRKVLQPFLHRDSLEEVASQVDRAVPALEERWMTILNLAGRNPAETGSTAMLDRVRTEAQSREVLVHPETIVDRHEYLKWRNITLGIAAFFLLMFLIMPMQMLVLLGRFCFPMADISLVKLESENKSMIVPSGESLTLSTLLTSGDIDEATLSINQKEEEEQQLSLALVTEGVDSPRFLHHIDSVEKPFSYRWRAGDGQTAVYTIDIAERPAFEQIKFKLTPPAYTKLPVENLDQLPPRVRAVKGSRLSIEFQVSQPLKTMTLNLSDDEQLVLNAVADHKFLYEVELDKSFSFSPSLVNEWGLTNRKPPLCRITVFEDRAPAVSIITPEDELAVPGDDTIDIEFVARDDFAVTKAELVLYKQDPLNPTAEPVEFKTIEIPLKEQQDKSYLQATTELDLSELNLEQDDVLSYAVRSMTPKRMFLTLSRTLC